MVTVEFVEPLSHAEKCGIKKGDIIISINGHKIKDVLDYRFYMFDPVLKISAERNGNPLDFEIKKPEYDDIGLEFSTYLMDEKKRCRNNCIFCFIDQNPKGMRDTIYFKDDDERLSFLMGNYVTLTNLSDEDIDRIIRMRISPVNISVHTTNPELRVKMMRNRFAGKCLSYIKKLDDAGIAINAQLVLCRGINDGEELKSTLLDLTALKNIESIAMVPCGMTGYRDGLAELSAYDKDSAREVIDIADSFGDREKEKRGTRLVYPSDEFFLLAEREIPPASYYEDYPQIDNGVGMIRSDSDEFFECLENSASVKYNNKRNITIATGEAAYAFIKKLADAAMKKCKNLNVNVFAVKNNFFGGNVTVSGLVTATDIIDQLKNKDLGEELLIPENMLRSEKDLFLDGMSLKDLEEKLLVPVKVCCKGGYPLCEAMLGTEEEG